jgi:AhpD family alkylhydroperoxidase
MSTIAAKPLSQYPWFIRLVFWKQKRTYGRILDPGLLWGRSPWVFAAVALLYGALDRRFSPIEPALRSLVTVRVSQINHCAFCVDINSATLVKRGVPMEKVVAISNWRDNALFEPEGCLALEFAEAMTIDSRGVDEYLRARLKR